MLLDAECTHDASIRHVAKGGSEALLLLRGRWYRDDLCLSGGGGGDGGGGFCWIGGRGWGPESVQSCTSRSSQQRRVKRLYRPLSLPLLPQHRAC